ncbi:1-deoxy-D-xylulose-5-phosphate reductoisomerase [Fonticella tunisiensis]|uniref:1-deoxy-D-xylulose 5-phosphate reductoisomerase n=1 Tax=Fonticella tunisiensis TaxID=1096341 RepID=A0A4R7KS33_9CLOT|nr:1-deoxy-D-xylulose-5-phosphate reductoisomerase [Fonticella tunisiensis]TDT61575.1 1-deoxy-D-xylulose 5-phosphate reductoisomerase [Fonticella tunisiensis]
MKGLCILGSTGSIGTQALDIIRRDRNSYDVIALSANSNAKLLYEQAVEFQPDYVVIMDDEGFKFLKEKLFIHGIKVLKGMEGLEFICTLHNVDMVLTSLVGMVGLKPTIAAIRAGKTIALANKETLVVGGDIITKELEKSKSKLLPVDSEHSALFQCLKGEDRKSIHRLILTASGGPFRGKRKADLIYVTPEMALKHPRWNMGKKISIDSATLMNKALEVIEAHWLFDIDYDSIDVVVHPQSIIHSMVEYVDGSIIAQLGNTDMRHPIQYAFEYPNRNPSVVGYLDLIKNNVLTFEQPDYETFECLELGYKAGKTGGSMPTVLNAANEEAVELFLKRKIKFLEIAEIIKESMNHFKVEYNVTLERIFEIEMSTRDFVNQLIK